MLEYRKATFEDSDNLVKLRLEMISENNSYDEEFMSIIKNNTKLYFFNEMQSGNYLSWIAIENNKIISMCGLSLFIIPPNDWCVNGKTGYIGNMYTKINYRKRGIGKYLLEKIIDEAKKNNCGRILLNTTEEGEKLYKNIGFKYSPTAMAYFPFGLEYEKYLKK